MAANGFFDAKHSVNLKAGDAVLEIRTQKELESVIASEKAAIIKDVELRKRFDAVQRQLDRNTQLRDFCRYLQDNEALLSRMDNLAKLKEDTLKSYINIHEALYLDLMEKMDAAAKRDAEIKEAARKEQTQWEEVIAIFNERFFVPFQLEARNRIEVMLGDDDVIDLGFTYIDGNDKITVAKPALLKVLSTGERKALYVLNVIFEIQRRIKDGVETLVVVDDIADSFDYQNKYAIIQYLKDISDFGLFKLIIMTHNFDFFSYIGKSLCRLFKMPDGVKKSGRHFAAPATGIRNVFANDWKAAFFTDPKKKIASIPFLRNLIEMTIGEDDSSYDRLTSMLHWKAGSEAIKVAELDEIYNSVCKTAGISDDPNKLLCDLIKESADSCLTAPTGLNLENKIVLAIAIRIAAERFMIDKINNAEFVNAIDANQTQRLISKYKQLFSNNTKVLQIVDRVALMTPENIHVNSFMYEPIVDMSDEHLKRLYIDVTTLA